jgi:hypothetical protein
MFENLHRRRFASSLPSRVTVVAALFVGWGVFKLLAAGLNAGSSTPFYIEWFAVLGGFLVVSGVLLYRRHRFGVPVGLLCLGVASLSNLYQLVVLYAPPRTLAGVIGNTLVAMIGVKLLFAYALVTIDRNR